MLPFAFAMCGRVTCKTKGTDLMKAFQLDFEPEGLSPRYNIAPSQPIPVVVVRPQRVLEHFRWGLIPSWASDEKIGYRMINARAETVAQKFRDALELRRCLVAVDGFYEWKAGGGKKEPKIPMYIHRRSDEPFAMAGLWERWKSPAGELIESCTIITVPPNELVKDIHNRMPAIVPKELHDLWLDPGMRDKERLLQVLRPYAGGDLEAYPVSQLVNSPANEAPECVQPQAPPPKRQLELL